MQPKLIIAFAHLTEKGFYEKARQINEALHSEICRSFYAETWPASVPSLGEVSAGFHQYRAAYEAAVGGEAEKIQTRKTARVELTRLLVRIVPYLELVAGQNIVMLTATGYDVHSATGSGLEQDVVPGDDGTKLPDPAPRQSI